MRELLNDLIQRLDILENQSTQLEDWEGFLAQTRALHERALIMRYKALERLNAVEVTATPEPDRPEQPIVWGRGVESREDQAASIQTESYHGAEPEAAELADAESAPEALPFNPIPLPSNGVSLAEKLSLQPLQSILPALGINDRVRFAGVLFNGDMTALQQACAAAETATSFEAARKAVLDRAQPGLDWSDEEEAPHQFMQLVQRVHLK